MGRYGAPRGTLVRAAFAIWAVAWLAVAFPSAGSSGPTAKASPPSVPQAPPPSPIALAERSLAVGGGPARAATTSCDPGPGAGSVVCAAPMVPAAANDSTFSVSGAAPAWDALSSSSGPGGRSWASMTYDAADGYVLLFGGYSRANGQYLGDTWTFADGTWTQLEPALAPTARAGASMAYDPRDGYVVLFGGFEYGGGGNQGASNQTWTYRAGNWTLLAPSSSPSGRAGAGLAYDAAEDCLVLFGGTSGVAYLNDTWTFRGGEWTGVPTAVAPSPRVQPLLTYDGHDGYLLLFGGQDATGALNDTWSYTESGWSERSVPTPPAVGEGAALAFDPYAGDVVLFGPLSASPSTSGTWVYADGAWSSLSLSTAPSVRDSPALALDATDGYLLLFGGAQGFSDLADSWAWEAPLVYGTQSATSVYLGENVTFAVDARSPAGDLRSMWAPSSSEMGCGTPYAGTLECTPVALGNYSIRVNVTDGAGAWTSGRMTVSVVPYPSVGSPVFSPERVDVGQTFAVSASASGGIGSYAWSWSGLPRSCTGTASPSVRCEATAPGNLTVTAAVTDGGGRTATSEPVTISVAPDPEFVAVTADPMFVDVGQSFQVTANISGGAAPYRWSWTGSSLANCTETNRSVILCTAVAPGTVPLTASVADANGFGVSSAPLALQIFAPPAAVLMATPAATFDVGTPLEIDANVSGGAGGLRYAWSGLPPGCAVPTGAVLNCTPLGVGVYTVKIVATDRAHDTAAARIKITITAPTRPAVQASSSIVLPLVAIVATVVAIGAAGLYLNRRRPSPSLAPPEIPPGALGFSRRPPRPPRA